MCGIVAVLRRRSDTTPPGAEELLGRVQAALEAVGPNTRRLVRAAELLETVNTGLKGVAGVRSLLHSPQLAARLGELMDELAVAVSEAERNLDAQRLPLTAAEVEGANASLVRLKDAVWAIRCDRLRTAEEISGLAAGVSGDAALEAFWTVQVALSALDRLEVRGRDSAGVHLLVTGHELDPDDPELATRAADPLFRSMSVRAIPAIPGAGDLGALAFVYKAAAEVGELGDNIRALRSAITGDSLLHRVLGRGAPEVALVGHTRWASVGIISEANAHPLNDEEAWSPAGDPPGAPRPGPYVAAALNGDVDNHLELRASEELSVPPEITTDAKVIPMLVSRRIAAGLDPDEAFRRTVAAFEGSVAIAAATAADPGRLLLALRGSGQALYIGLAQEAFVVASEPYGLIEETSRYLRMDGEATAGQVVVLDRARAGRVDGIDRRAYDSRPLPVEAREIVTAEITTRDVDRAGYPHFLLKEISEAPQSFRKTLRGKVIDRGGRLAVVLGDESLPGEVRHALAKGDIRRIFVIGQGTAAIAGQVLAANLVSFLPPAAGIAVSALPATELSGFWLDDDMSDALVVAISQSGTTTDTNRTVDLVRARGASVLAVVNRRNSDLVEKADGVLYTSDGRDVEMSVPSTKAFYAQIAAGFLLALALADEAGGVDPKAAHELLVALRELPAAMEGVLELRPSIAAAASEQAPRRRHWAVVGNGANRLAAAELRIKLSELAYKSIAHDATEDKKHIDLSSEPLILVCATGLVPEAAADVAKELAIYRAHKAAPVVIATKGTEWPAALATIEVPEVHPALAFVLSTVAGHLFGYEAALAIDAQARALREVRAMVEGLVSDWGVDDLVRELGQRLTPATRSFHEQLRQGAYNGALEAGTAVELSSVLRYTTGAAPLEFYELDHGRVATPGVIVEDLLASLTQAIDQLTRPVDAIRHQAKTVTVGISRSEEALFGAPLVVETLRTGARRDRLTYRVLRTLVALGPAVEEVTGYTRYEIAGFSSATDQTGLARIHVVDKGGVATAIPSRAEADGGTPLRGTKHRAATLREVTVAKGATDGRTVVLVPEIRRGDVVGMTLLHARFADRLMGPAMRAVLEGYQARYGAIVDAVTEKEPHFDDQRLAEFPVIDLLTTPVLELARIWTQ